MQVASKYRGGNGFTIVLIILVGLMVILLGANSSLKNILHNLTWGGVAIAVIVLASVYSTYLLIDDGELVYVNLGLFQRRVKVSQIISIEKVTNIAFQKRLMVSFRDDDAQIRHFLIYDAFSESTLSMFFRRMLNGQSHIQLDEYCRKLMEKV